MENININKILNREHIKNEIIEFLKNFNTSRNDITLKRGIYISSEPGSGKTCFINEIVKEANYDNIYYNASDIRNKSVIDTIAKNNMADKNVIDMFHKKSKSIVIIMDEIDGMNSGDKGGINALIKLIRPKKTKKQKTEEITNNPIICIGNHHMDKKIKEILKVCHSYILNIPTNDQIKEIIINIFSKDISDNNELLLKIINYVQGDLRRLNQLYNIYKKSPDLLKEVLYSCHPDKNLNEDTKDILIKLFKNPFNIEDHLSIINETDRTIIGLLWHENIIDIFSKIKDNSKIIPFYRKVLDNICYSDYVDRITFQKQIWQLNEMTSLIKTMKNNLILHNTFYTKNYNFKDIRFTKVLTKYSTEYNNSLFLQQICKQLDLDKKDMILFFSIIKDLYNEIDILNELENYEMNKLDYSRIIKFINKIYNIENG